MKTAPRRKNAFALVATLAVLVMVVILITAFVSTMRTERIASHNYSAHRQAEALAQSVLNRLVAENTAPILSNGQALKAYTLKTDGSQLPDDDTKASYLSDTPEPGIFRIEPQDDISTANHLVRLSRSAAAVPAFTPAAWKYLRLEGDIFQPRDKNGNPTSPHWIDYSLPNGSVVGQVAFAIWQEDGKLDVNLAGPDGNLNGMAPHNLEIENLSSDAPALLELLNGTDGSRQRSNFSLRRISTDSALDSTGDDRRVFSIEELLRKNLIDDQGALRLTTFSRDFDVRPEWDGVRNQATAQQFLRSYVNNPDLYMLMSGGQAGTAGPGLVKATMNEQTLRNTLTSKNFPATESWMQIMRLLAALRISLPPYQTLTAPPKDTALGMESWTDNDIWGIALNIVQASDALSDQNLIAWNQALTGNVYEDPNLRMGIRISPLITEVALKLTRTGTNTFSATEYAELWNPYSVDLQPYTYDVGETTGNYWPYAGGSIWTNTGTDGNWKQTNVTGPAAGGFRTVNVGTKTMTFSGSNLGIQNAGNGFRVRFSPFVVDTVFRSGTKGVDFQVSKGPAYSNSNASPANQFPYQLTAWIPEANMPAMGESVWYSYQIDDPRMGPFTRYSANRVGNATSWPANDPGWAYSWQGYLNQHSLAGVADGPQYISPLGEGYNVNFGDNWPASWPKNSVGLNRALATFALPGRPFRNVGELGTVFAFRPWRTLGFAATTAPEHGTIPAPSKTENSPMALFDYLTTLGTVTDSQTLNYKIPPGAATGGFNMTNVNARREDKRWLFEKVDAVGNPAGPLRPIRGKINLNSADEETLTTLLKAPYRMVNSLGLQNWSGLDVNTTEYAPDLKVRISESDARAVAVAIADPASGIRPLRSLADLARLDTEGVLADLYDKYPKSVVDAMMGRLAQFGTIRQQIYTFDILARTLNPEAKKRGKDIVTSEARLLARVYFDTFSRKAFVESVEYR